MRIHTLDLVTVDGVHLAADLATVSDPVAAAVLAHPHPAYGGTRHHPLIDGLFHRLAALGVTVARFDFRGGGASGGTTSGGRDERWDVAAALDAVATAAGRAPFWLIGYSFGALVGLEVIDERLHGWIGIAPPLTMGTAQPLAALDPRPKHLVVPAHDQFCPPSQAAAATAGWVATTLEELAMADHFLHGRVEQVVNRATSLIGLG